MASTVMTAPPRELVRRTADAGLASRLSPLGQKGLVNSSIEFALRLDAMDSEYDDAFWMMLFDRWTLLSVHLPAIQAWLSCVASRNRRKF
jgi:hypothetical protein